MAPTEKWWATSCKECGGFVLVRPVAATELAAPQLEGEARCVRCHATNKLSRAELFVVDGRRLRRIRLSSPIDYVK